MKSSKQTLIINHSAKDLYNIVLDIEKYPEFIPWCKKISIKSKKNNQILADMVVSYKFLFPQTFTSSVSFDSKQLLIKSTYVDGPLKNLNTEWTFKKINNNKTKVIFNMNFEFENLFHQKLAEIFFKIIENKMVNSFQKRADKILN